MKNIYLVVIIAILTGYLFSMFLFNEYDVDANKTDVYFILYGTYDNYDEMLNNTISLDNYIYNYDDKYNVYVGFTKDENILYKLQGYFNNMDYNTSSEVFQINDENLIEIIDDYDLILNNVSEESYKYVLNDMLKKYKDVINE